MQAKHKLIIESILFCAIILVITFVDLPGESLLVQELQNTGHTLVFGTLSLLVLRSSEQFGIPKHAGYRYAMVFTLIFGAGVIVELLQWVFHRDADVIDVLRDIAGIVSFLGIYSPIDKSLRANRQRSRAGLLLLTATVSVSILIIAMLPFTRLALHYYQRNAAFPVLVNFSSSWASDFVSVTNAEYKWMPETENRAPASGDPEFMLKFKKNSESKFTVLEPVSDWSEYKYLNFIIYSKSDSLFSLSLRVHDRSHNQQYNDRFNRVLKIQPGKNVVHVAMADIRDAPQLRAINLHHIARLIMFTNGLQADQLIYLSNIWLD